jgi:hypothetical protein
MCVDKDGSEWPEEQHQDDQYCHCLTQPSVGRDAARANQCYLGSEKNQEADKYQRVHMHDGWIIQSMLLNVLIAVGPKSREYADPHQESQDKEYVAP